MTTRRCSGCGRRIWTLTKECPGCGKAVPGPAKKMPPDRPRKPRPVLKAVPDVVVSETPKVAVKQKPQKMDTRVIEDRALVRAIEKIRTLEILPGTTACHSRDVYMQALEKMRERLWDKC